VSGWLTLARAAGAESLLSSEYLLAGLLLLVLAVFLGPLLCVLYHYLAPPRDCHFCGARLPPRVVTRCHECNHHTSWGRWRRRLQWYWQLVFVAAGLILFAWIVSAWSNTTARYEPTAPPDRGAAKDALLFLQDWLRDNLLLMLGGLLLALVVAHGWQRSQDRRDR
jgi:hypothetical protein